MGVLKTGQENGMRGSASPLQWSRGTNAAEIWGVQRHAASPRGASMEPRHECRGKGVSKDDQGGHLFDARLAELLGEPLRTRFQDAVAEVVWVGDAPETRRAAPEDHRCAWGKRIVKTAPAGRRESTRITARWFRRIPRTL